MAILTLSTQIVSPVKYPTLPVAANSLDFAFTAPTAFVDGIDFAATGREVLLVQNADAGAQTVTLLSSADALNRTGDITAYSLSAGEFCVFIPPVSGFAGANGRILTTMSNANVKVAVIRLPNQI